VFWPPGKYFPRGEFFFRGGLFKTPHKKRGGPYYIWRGTLLEKKSGVLGEKKSGALSLKERRGGEKGAPPS